MGKIQRVQQQSPPLRVVKSNQQRRQPAPPAPANSLFNLLQKHPILVLTGVSVGLLALASIAALYLTNPGHIEISEISSAPQPAPTNVVVQPPPPVAVENSAQTEDNEGALPVAWFGAIALGGGAGFWLLLRGLMRPRRRRRVRQGLNNHPASKRPALKPQQRPNPPRQVADSHRRHRQQPLPNRSAANLSQRQHQQQPIPPNRSVRRNATELSPTSHYSPVKQDRTNLASRMDLRRRNSLSSFLRNS